MAHDVYISASSRDYGVASRFVDGLERSGIRCWWAPRDIAAGASFGDAIVDAIEGAQAIVLLFSGSTDASEEIKREITFASRGRLPIVPVRIEDVTLSGVFRYELANRHWIDAFPPNEATGIETLIGGITTILGRRPLATDAPANKTPAATNAPKKGKWSFLSKLLSLGAAPDISDDSETSVRLVEALSKLRLEDLASIRLSLEFRNSTASLGSTIPQRLERILRQARQVVLLQDSGRRLETANEALGELAALQDELTARSGSTARAVGQVVANWVGLFRAEIASLEGAVEALRDIENPFTFGNPVQARDTGLFTGRRDIVLEIERNLLRSAQTPTLLLYGQRRMGKTSILNQLPTLLGPRFLPVTVDCQTPQMAESQPAMLRYVSRCLANSLNLRLRAASASNASEAELAPISLTDLREDAYSHFEDWLDGFEARLPADARLLLCLDEFERLQSAVDAGWGLHFLDSLRHWAQHRPRFAVMFIGSHTFEQLGAAWTDRFLSARRLKVSFLSDEDCRRLLTRPTSTFKLVYEPEAIAGIIRQTHGQPYLTQALASELVHYLNGERRKMANAGDIEIAVAKALYASGEYFADLWFGRTNDERRILSEIAAGVASASENPTIRTLRDYDILDESGDYAVPMVKRWVLAQNVWT